VSADEDRDRQARRTRAARRAAQRRHPAGGRIQPAELRAVPSQPNDQAPGLAAQDNQETR
jgi:hypothetical protein